MIKELIPITKIKPLLPSLREKKRYVSFEIISKKKVSSSSIRKSIESSCLQYLGELNYGKSGIMFLADKFNDNKGILRVNVKNVNDLKACLALNDEFQIRSTSTSGVINKAEKFSAA